MKSFITLEPKFYNRQEVENFYARRAKGGVLSGTGRLLWALIILIVLIPAIAIEALRYAFAFCLDIIAQVGMIVLYATNPLFEVKPESEEES